MINLDVSYIRDKVLNDLQDPFNQHLYSIKMSVEHNARFNRTVTYYVFNKDSTETDLIKKIAIFLQKAGFKLSYKKIEDAPHLILFIINL